MVDRGRMKAMVCLALVIFGSMGLFAQGVEWNRRHYSKEEVRIPMRDGVELFTIIYSPRERARTFPILMNRTPYGVAPYGKGAFRDGLGPSPQFAREGFIFVYQDVRGCFMSGGHFVDMTPRRDVKSVPEDVDESTDTYDTIAWLLVHAAGNNGRVGQWGISYPGFYTAAGMIEAHPALVAVSPQAPIVDWFTGDDFHRNGALWLPHLFNFIASFGRPRSGPTKTWPESFQHGTSDGYAFFLKLGSLASVDEHYFHRRIPFWEDVMAHGTYDAYWKTRDLRPRLKDIRPAVLVVGGWFDAENLYGALQVYQALQRQSPGTQSFLVMGPWYHGAWERDGGDHLGDVPFGSRTSDYFLENIELPFFLHHLKDAPDPRLPKAFVFETGVNQWHRLDAWPSKETRTARVYFQAGGRLDFEHSPSAQGSDDFISDPAKPVPFLNRIAIGMPVDYMTADQRFAATRPDVLTYETGPLDADLTVAGPIRVHLDVSTTGTDADWVVKVIDVYPDDAPNTARTEQDVDGWEPPCNPMGGYEQLVRGEVMRGKFRNSFERPEPFVPGQTTPVEWSLNDVFHTFRAGHRFMVQVQSSWFPLMDRNPQVFTDIYSARAEDFHKATHKVFWTSYLELPLLTADRK